MASVLARALTSIDEAQFGGLLSSPRSLQHVEQSVAGPLGLPACAGGICRSKRATTPWAQIMEGCTVLSDPGVTRITNHLARVRDMHFV